MKVLALVPPDEEATEIAAYGFLCDEFASLVKRGIEVHTISPVSSKPFQRDNVIVHAMPRHRADPLQCFANMRMARQLQATLPLHLKKSWWSVYTPAAIERFSCEIVEQYNIDLIHSCFAYPSGSAGTLVKKTTGRPLLLSVRGFEILSEPSIGYGARLNPVFDALFRRSLAAADLITANSLYTMEQVISLGIGREKCLLVPRAVDEGLFTPVENGANCPNETKGYPTVLCVRHIVPKNGIEYLVSAARIVVDQRPNVRFVFCGREDKKYQHELNKQLASLNLANHVRFTGFIPHQELVNYFRNCSLSVIPSVIEAAGNVTLEAMACAKPVIGSNVGGIPDYISDNETGFLVEPMNPQALAQRILQLLDDPALAERMGRAGRRRVESHFRYDFMISKLVALYETVVANHQQIQPAAISQTPAVQGA